MKDGAAFRGAVTYMNRAALLRKPLRTMRSADSDMKIIWSCTRN